jgi:hypothetical protein
MVFLSAGFFLQDQAAGLRCGPCEICLRKVEIYLTEYGGIEQNEGLNERMVFFSLSFAFY